MLEYFGGKLFEDFKTTRKSKKDYNRTYYLKTLEYQRARRLKNKEMHRAASAKYQKKLLLKIKNGEADPAWLKKRRDGKNMNAKKCYIVHREKTLEKNKKYYAENKIKIKLRRIELEIEREEKAKNDQNN